MAAVDMAKIFALCSPTEFERLQRALHQCQGFLAQLYENVMINLGNTGSPMVGYGHPSPRRTEGEYGTIRELAVQEIGSPYGR